MLEQAPKINMEKEPAFVGHCEKCGGEFKVFITPGFEDEDSLASAELKKIQTRKLCPNCQK